MRRDEFPPCSVLAALGGRCEAMALKHVADGLGGDLMPEVGQGASDSVITPTGVLARHLYNERFDIGGNTWPPGIRTPLGAIEFLCYEPPVPGQNGGRFGHAGHLGQILPAEALADLGEGGSLRIRQPEPSGKLRA